MLPILVLLMGCTEYDLIGDEPIAVPAGDGIEDSPEADWWNDPWREPPPEDAGDATNENGEGDPVGSETGHGSEVDPEGHVLGQVEKGDIDGDGLIDGDLGDDGDGGGVLRGDLGSDLDDDFDDLLEDDFDDDLGDDDDDDDPLGAARMTGGGDLAAGSHGFTVHCAGTHHANNLQINWEGGGFHLEDVDWVHCLDDPNLEPEGPPTTEFDTVVGVGWGRLGSGAADIWFQFTDAGEPGDLDHAWVVIDDGTTVRELQGYLVDGGNHQAHGPVH